MYYYEKYIKYKRKYVNYIKSLQFGGAKPLNNIIKNINLFTNPDMEEYLNPIYGLVMCETDYIVHNYDLYVKNFINTNDSQIIKNISKRLPETVKPSDEITQNIRPIDIGRYIAILYVCKENVDFIIYGKENKITLKTINEAKQNYFNKKDTKNIEICDEDILKLTKFIDKNKLIKRNFKFNKIEKINFYILLYCLWWITNNKNDIKDYYDGINEVFNIVNKYLGEKHIEIINIPSNFISDIFTLEELIQKPNNDSFELCIFKIIETFKVIDYEKSYNLCNPKFTFPDCGETTARNLINLICFHENKFNIEILKELGAINELIEYYTTFNNFSAQTSTDVSKIYNDYLNPRDAWSKLITNFANNNIVFIQECPSDKCKRFELKPGLSHDKQTTNFFQLIKNLLTSIEEWDDLLVNNIEEINEEIDNGTREIIIFHKIYNEIIIKLEERHYYMKIEQKNLNYNYSHICNENQKNFLNILTDKIKINKDNYLWKKFTDETFINEYEEDDDDDDDVYKLRKELLELSSTYKFDIYLRENLTINTDRDLKLVDINKLEFNDYRYKSNDNFEFVKKIPELQYLSHEFSNYFEITEIDLSPLSNIIFINTLLLGCEKLKSINLSPLQNVTEIGDGFLIGCKSLTSVNLSPFNKVESIGNEFLSNCNSLSNVDLLPLENITTIGYGFLANCYKLEYINLSPLKNITNIGSQFLSECINLKSIDLSPLKNVTTIDNAFLYKCKKLKSINLSSLTKVKFISDEFMAYCSSLESINLSPLENVTEIGEEFLIGCKSLISIDLSPFNKVESIGNKFLSMCINLKSIDLSPLTKVKIIGYEFMANCSSLESVDISYMENLTEIYDDFLSENRKLKKIICTNKQKEILMINNSNLEKKIIIKN